MDAFGQLPLKAWVRDFGFRRHMNVNYSGMGDYYCEEKSSFTLFRLLNYLDEDGIKYAVEYYRFPGDMHRFVGWVWSNVALNTEIDIPDDKTGYELFPFKELYDTFILVKRQHVRVVVHTDKITDHAGYVFCELPQSLKFA